MTAGVINSAPSTEGGGGGGGGAGSACFCFFLTPKEKSRHSKR